MNLAEQPIHPYKRERNEQERSLGYRDPIEFDGMTLRQHYAGLAMHGLLANGTVTTKGAMAGTVARVAIEHADALIKALEGA